MEMRRTAPITSETARFFVDVHVMAEPFLFSMWFSFTF
jgi:hypothetical protein